MFFAGLAIGFLAGWILFKRPEWATNAINWIKGKLSRTQAS